MNNPKPPPQCKALLLCDHVILDSFTGKISLINVIEGFDLNYYPALAPVIYYYAILVNGIGHYDFKIEISICETTPWFMKMPSVPWNFSLAPHWGSSRHRCLAFYFLMKAFMMSFCWQTAWKSSASSFEQEFSEEPPMAKSKPQKKSEPETILIRYDMKDFPKMPGSVPAANSFVVSSRVSFQEEPAIAPPSPKGKPKRRN